MGPRIPLKPLMGGARHHIEGCRLTSRGRAHTDIAMADADSAPKWFSQRLVASLKLHQKIQFVRLHRCWLVSSAYDRFEHIL